MVTESDGNLAASRLSAARQAVEAALQQTGGNRSKAAQILGISRSSLMLRTARERGLWPEGTDTITQRELRRLQREGRLDVVSGGLNEQDPGPGNGGAAPDNYVLLNNPLRCDPYEEGSAPPGFDGWECLPSDQEYEQSVPDVANARAGDIPLSSACGMVGSLLRAVSPAQRFSHNGIFTRSQDQIRHSTAVESRIQEGMGHSSQIDARRLTYPQPGIITPAETTSLEFSTSKTSSA